MAKIISKEDFKNYMVSIHPISESDFERLVEDFNSYYDTDVKEYIRSRHFHLKKQGMANEDIYRKLEVEIENRRFKSPVFSTRQIRRIIYG
ncbi:MAG: hypothetical protein GY859_10780 [Desulfobacterales bacterium]|nr:hypothetical protein [Desulfobacterales bacterium]